MNIFGVGLPEVTVILIIALLIFGPKKLPELGKQLGKTLKSLKKASNEFQNEIDQVMSESNVQSLSDKKDFNNPIDNNTSLNKFNNNDLVNKQDEDISSENASTKKDLKDTKTNK
tara:strand:+ start:394 stop:738 length:345 start_codon:yes stop_codon:yes gene_type:complete